MCEASRLITRRAESEGGVRGFVLTIGRSLRVALVSYRSKPHCGGQGIYVRHLARELAALGHHVDVLSGQPYPELDPVAAGTGSVNLRPLPSLDLYRDDDPFRTPPLREWRGLPHSPRDT